MLLASRRLPGIRFEAPPPPPALVLPRMDVAGFVGYASAGPPDVPVPVEDAGEFADVFGDDLPLAWDDARGEPAYAALAPAVRSFFRNGGRRCFVVRVADRDARATAFEVPGLVGVSGSRRVHALLRARSVGAWADAIRVGAAVTATPLMVRNVALRAGTFDVIVSAGAVETGDMVRLRFGGWTLLAAVAATSAGGPAQASPVDPARSALLSVTAGERLWVAPVDELPAVVRAVWAGPVGALRSAGASVRSDGRVLVRTAFERAPGPEALVRLTGGPDDVWARVAECERSADGLVLRCEAVRLRSTPPPGLLSPRGRMPAERLELELRTQSATASGRLGGLGFALGHPRFVGDLPADDELYAGEAPDQPELWRDARAPRFALAAPPDDGARPPAYFPVLTSLLADRRLAALPPEAAARRRDGVTRFHPSVFVDERLADLRTTALLAQADHVRYGAGLATPERLRGLHALLGVDAVSLVAVPDAAQAGWVAAPQADPAPPAEEPPAEEPDSGTFRACAPSALVAPDLEATGDAGAGTLALTWDAPPSGSEVEVEEAADAAFETAAVIYRGGGRELTLGGRPDGPHWYRARFVAPAAAGPRTALGPVGTLLRPRALLRRPDQYSDRVLVAVHRALVRMCAARGDLFALLALPEHYSAAAAIGHPAALRVQQAAPANVPALGEGETMTLSYAALHHPWLVTVSEERPGELRRVPPDGAMAGVAARRSVERGAWVAPANVELLDVVALSRATEAPRRSELFDAQVNVVERTPRGFMALSADTLAAHPDLRPVNVRRLLQLLRRLALRHGETYTFEPNGDELRRTTEHGFETVLGALFVLGAFSGAHPDEAFRVVAGSPPNTPRTLDAGQLVVELKVAPSRPLAFLTVRLVRAGDGRLVVETV